MVTDENGVKEQDVAYYPYGDTRINTPHTSPAVDIPYKYTGKEQDDSTGLYFYEARYYDPILGRFISPDTIVPDPSNPQAFNRYTYALNNPLRYTDPSGQTTATSNGTFNIRGSNFNETSRFESSFPQFNFNLAPFNSSFSNTSFQNSSPNLNRVSAPNTRFAFPRFAGLFSAPTLNIPFLLKPGHSLGSNGFTLGSNNINDQIFPQVNNSIVADDIDRDLRSLTHQEGLTLGCLLLLFCYGDPPALFPFPLSMTNDKTGQGKLTEKTFQTLEERAADLVRRNNGKNRVSIRTQNGRLNVDLQGKPHGGVPTPHVQAFKDNIIPYGVRAGQVGNRSKVGPTRPATTEDLRLVDQFLKSQGR